MGNGQLTKGEDKLSGQLAFNSFLTGVNVYTNMKINKSMQEANELNKQLHEESSKQTDIMEQDLAIKEKEHQEKELIKQVKESVFQINKELKNLTEKDDLIEVFLSLESLYATLVSNNITTDIVPDIQDKEFIENVYSEIDKQKKETESKFNKQDKDDLALLIDILEEDEEEEMKKITSEETYNEWGLHDLFLSGIEDAEDKEIIQSGSELIEIKHKFFKDKGYIGEKKGGKFWSLLFFISLGFIGFSLYRYSQFPTNEFLNAIWIFSVLLVFSFWRLSARSRRNKKIDAFYNRTFSKEERHELKELITEKYKDLIEKFAPLKKKLDEFEERIEWEKGKSKELVSRRAGLNAFLQSRAV